MNFNEIDYQQLTKMFDNTDMFRLPDYQPVRSINIPNLSEKFPLAVLCVAEKENELSENENVLLQKILSYIGYNLTTTPVFVCTQSQPYTLCQLAATCRFAQLIIFGGKRTMQMIYVDSPSHAEGIGYKPIQINGMTIFFVHSLSELELNLAHKTKLLNLLNTNFKTKK
jgi:hypothetical protein